VAIKIKIIILSVIPIFALTVFILPKITLADSSGIYINEIMIEGSGGEEFIELYNSTNSDFSLKNHYLDYYSSGRNWENPYRNKKFPDDAIIQSKGYFLILIKSDELAPFSPDWDLGYSSHQLSDSSGSIAIFPDNKFSESTALDMISWGTVAFVGKGKELTVPGEGNSLEKSESIWHKSSTVGGTPGKENSPELKAKESESTSSDIVVINEKNIYKNIFADFDVECSCINETTKYTWSFGDGHKSYKKAPRHKYETIGSFSGSIKIRNGKESAIQNFKIEVGNFENAKVKIIRLSPNPKGLDKNEWIEIENKSKKKINLKNWSIATGWKKLINHPIREDFIIKPGKSKKLMKKICAFTLNNEKNKIELRYPNGEVAQKLKYNRKMDKIEEDEIFEMSEKKWVWDKSQVEVENKESDNQNGGELQIPDQNSIPEESSEPPVKIDQEIELNVDESEIQTNLGKYSENPDFVAKKQNRIQLIGYSTRINTPLSLLDNKGVVAGALDERKIVSKKHWLNELTEILWIKLNSTMNSILNNA
jgi:hypothetical protein